jgi:hypothetical protein
MSSFTVPAGCTGVELPNGTKLDANRAGKVTVDNPADERAVAKSVGIKTGVIGKSMLGFSHMKENTAHCSGCVFTGFGWQSTCPKCGAEMIKETQ